jgi:hypothetical protein
MASVPVVLWVLPVVGVLVLVAGAGMLLWTRVDIARMARAEATVVAEAPKDEAGNKLPDAMRGMFWYAEFTDRRGKRQRFFLGASVEMNLGALKLADISIKLPPAGSSIPILFDPNNPLRAKRDTFEALWRTPLVVLALGAAVTVVATGFAIAIARGMQ